VKLLSAPASTAPKKVLKKSGPTPAILSRKVAFQLPTEKNVPSVELGQYSILLYGRKKIGKTSMAAQFPDAFIISCEPGAKALRVYSSDVTTWEDVDGCIDAAIDDTRFKTIVVDTVDLLYSYAFQHICDKQFIEHPNEENDFGHTWGKIRKLFRSAINRILKSGKGAIFISHDTEKEVEGRDGEKFERLQPTLSKQALEEIEGAVDIIALYDYVGTERWLRLDGSQFVVAGCRCEESFIRLGGNPNVLADRIHAIPLGTSAKEAYQNFVKAFKNQQVDPDLPKPPVVIKKPLVKTGHK
jgi:hypothetical protein